MRSRRIEGLRKARTAAHATRGWSVAFACWLFLCAEFSGGCGPSSPDQDRSPPVEKPAVSVTVMTYNVLVDLPNPEYDPWVERRAHLSEIVRKHDPDLIGLQEPLSGQVRDLLQLCPGYQAITLEPPLDFFTDAAILFRADRFEKVSQGSFWLSPTPDVPLSGGLGTGFGNFLPRMVLWAGMRDSANQVEFYFVNTHFDNTNPSQERSSPLFIERLSPLAEEAPVIAAGDFNSKPGSVAYQTLTEGVGADGGGPFRLTDSFGLAPDFSVTAREGDVTEYDPAHRIDHVFASGAEFFCPSWTVDMTTYGPERRYPSDHFAVIAVLRWVPGE